MNIFKKLNLTEPISNRQGQGALEYILLLAVIVAIIVGLIFQFNKDFSEYADNYFGKYLRCLLQEGELPNLGVESGGVSVSSCDKDFKPFTLSEGRPPNDNNNSNSNSDKNKTSDGKGTKNSPKKFSSNSGGGSGGSGRNRSASGGRSGSNGGSQSFPAKGKNTERKKDKIVVGGGDSSTIGKLNNGKGKDSGSSGKNNKTIDRFQAYDPDKDKKEKGNIKVKSAKSGDDKDSGKSKAFRQAASIKKNKTPEIDDGFSFGDYLRYLIIAAILIVLLFVVGGQIFQATKGADN